MEFHEQNTCSRPNHTSIINITQVSAYRSLTYMTISRAQEFTE